jgi:hypothetical protein
MRLTGRLLPMPKFHVDIRSDEVGQFVELDIYHGDRCILTAEIDNELPFTERVGHALALLMIINDHEEGDE